MDIMPPPRPVAVATPAPVPAPAPIQQTQPAQPSPQPLYSNTPRPAATPVSQEKAHNILPKLRLVLLVVGVLLMLAGTARWASAGSTSGNLISAGAVSANDGTTMTIQFTADDGQMHKFTNKSDSALIPGSAVEVAYKSGAADKSAKRVAPIKAAHSLGISLLVTGVVLGLFAGLITLIMHRPKRHHATV
jgi:hypothetical protein